MEPHKIDASIQEHLELFVVVLCLKNRTAHSKEKLWTFSQRS